MPVQFETDPYGVVNKERYKSQPSGKIAGVLIKFGIVKTEASVQKLLVVVFILSTLVTIILLLNFFGSTSSTITPDMEKNRDINQMEITKWQQSQIQK